jgi:hypothetical protein
MNTRMNLQLPTFRQALGLAGLVVALLLGSLFAGVFTAFAPQFAFILMVMGVAVTAGFLLPVPWLLVATLVISAIFAGSLEYFLRFSQANWIPFVLAVFLAVRATVEARFGTSAFRLGPRAINPGVAMFVYPAIVYLTVLVASGVANQIPGAQAFAAAKNYLMMWGVLVALVTLPLHERTFKALWRTVVIVGALQLPVVLFQRFFIASRLGNTSGSLSFDAISGTFGGGLTGGRSGALAMFICIAVAYLLILWRDKQLGGGKLLGALLLLLPTLSIVEVKAVVFWLPAVAFFVFIAQIRRRPFMFFAGLAASAVLVLAVIAAYRFSYYSPGGDRSLASFFTRDLAYMWDPDRFNPTTREMGRISVLVHWWRESQLGSLVYWLFGYGPGASRGVSTVAVGTLASKYPFFIDISTAAALLWDVGTVGFLSFCSLLGFAALEARRLKRVTVLPVWLRHQLEASMIGLLLILSSVIYVRDAIDGTTIQFMTFFFLGTVVFARREAAQAAHRQPATEPLTRRLAPAGRSGGR